MTEIKFENSIDRTSAVANPRQIERVISGVEFEVNIVYDVHNSLEDLQEDMELLSKAMRLLQLDYLGGYGTRGSGRVSFNSITLTPVECDIEPETLRGIASLFRDVESYELLSV